MAKRGRPRIEINWAKLQDLCSVMCTMQECADVLGISDQTLMVAIQREFKMNFLDWSRQFQSKSKAELREKQWHTALRLMDPRMLIHLGKFHLGQNDFAIAADGLQDRKRPKYQRPDSLMPPERKNAG